MRLFFAVLLILFASSSVAQVPITDAIKLKDLINPATGTFDDDTATVSAVKAVVKTYTSGSLKVVFKTNPFLKEYCLKLADKTEAGSTGLESEVAGKSINTGSIIIDAFARFIVDRIKKELQAAFFQKLYDLISKEEYADCRTLFPHTYKTLLSIGDQVYNYELYLTSLRNSFGQDLQIVLPNLEAVIRNGRYAQFFSAHLELRSICLISLYIAKGLKNGDHIGTIIENFDPNNTDYIPSGTTDGKNVLIVHSVQFIQEISKSLKSLDANPNRYWVDKNTLNHLKDETTFKLYLGLLYERVKEIKLGSGSDENFAKLLEAAKVKLDQLKSLIENFASNINECEDQLVLLRANQSPENYLNYLNAISNVFNGVRDAQPFSGIVLPPAVQALVDEAWKLLDNANFVIDNSISIYGHLKGKQYSLVIVDVRNIYKERFKPDDIDNNHSGEKKQIEKVFDFLLDYGSALAEIAEAQTSKEVYAVIDRIAAPVGSSRVKKENVFSISLNAYGGPFLGKENIENVKDNGFVNNYGLVAPVGLAFSFGRLKADKDNSLHGNKSLTLFLSIVDLGAPVSFRFQNDTLDEIPAVKLKDIISPGAHLIWGFGKVPISFTIGAQVGPNLRKVTSQYNEYANSRYWRFSSGLYVDIPVFIFHRQKYW
jgi:hypothetical protein